MSRELSKKSKTRHFHLAKIAELAPDGAPHARAVGAYAKVPSRARGALSLASDDSSYHTTLTHRYVLLLLSCSSRARAKIALRRARTFTARFEELHLIGDGGGLGPEETVAQLSKAKKVRARGTLQISVPLTTTTTTNTAADDDGSDDSLRRLLRPLL